MRRSLPPLGWGLLLGLLLCGNARAQGKPEPRIAFEGSSVVASGLTPGKAVAWFGVERIVDPDLAAELVQHSDAKTAGADGVSRLELTHSVAQRSLWVAVDVESGDFVVAAPDGYTIHRRPRPSRLVAGEGGRPDEIEDGPSYLFGLMVRPGEGAWTFRGGDGAPLDADGETDGRVRFALEDLEPLPGSPAPPAKARGSDLWFVVDLLFTRRLSIAAGGAMLNLSRQVFKAGSATAVRSEYVLYERELFGLSFGSTGAGAADNATATAACCGAAPCTTTMDRPSRE